MGSGPPLLNYKNIGFLSNTGLDPLKITELSLKHSMLAHHRSTYSPHKTRKKKKIGPPLRNSSTNSGFWMTLPHLTKLLLKKRLDPF